ncbi:MAG: hypothetical protein HUU57_10670 [Bdellovibrio sp.]|nr:hypothetical protein [Bdellovibrio sp.]
MSIFLAGSTALAQIPPELRDVVLSGNMNGRGSLNFRNNAGNIVSEVPKDSEGSIVEVKQLKKTRSWGIKIRVTKVGDSKSRNKAKVGDEVWVYFAQKDPWLALKDKDGAEVQDPEAALVARAKRDGSGIPAEGAVATPHLPTPEEIKAEAARVAQPGTDPNEAMYKDPKQIQGTTCITCEASPAPRGTSKENLKDIGDIKTEVQRNLAESTKNTAAGIWANHPEVLRYSESTDVKKMITYADRNKRSRSTGYCYRYVKRAMIAGEIVKKYPPGAYARNGLRDLKAQGMINMLEDPRYKDLIKSPADVPKGAIIVYHNGDKAAAGDTQIKSDWASKGKYYSDFASSNSYLLSPKARQAARNKKPYRMIGVMIKETP